MENFMRQKTEASLFAIASNADKSSHQNYERHAIAPES
jgi:hypothetical protein